jgi:hypothetical protein
MRRADLLGPCLSAALLISCGIFLEDIGGAGEPCSENGDCLGDLVCNFGTCGPPADLGESCDEYVQNYVQVSVCDEGLWCIDGECVEVGGPGQPCSGFYTGNDDYDDDDNDDYEDDGGECDSGLYCIGGTCMEAGGEGQPCIDYDEWEDEGICDGGLRCVDGVCTGPLPDTVEQPGSGRVWLRCPIGMEWSGWECTGTVSDQLWSQALNACPAGFDLPSLDDFVQILSGCDSQVINHSEYGGECDSCGQSPECDAMFTNDPTGSDDGWNGDMKSAEYWTRTVGMVIGSSQYPYLVDFGGGLYSVDTCSNMGLWQALTLCIKY